MSNQPVYWKMRNGRLISIDDMDINHLRNTLKMIVKNSNKHKEQKRLHDWIDIGDMAQQFNDNECDATEIDLY